MAYTIVCMTIHSECFRTYDIRAIVGDDFNERTYTLIGKAFIQYLRAYGGLPEGPIGLAAGYDARNHSPRLYQGLLRGLTSADAEVSVLDLGLAPTPAVYFTEYCPDLPFPIQATLTVTGSHNGAEYNGLKFTVRGKSINSDVLRSIRRFTEALDDTAIACDGEIQRVIPYDIKPVYIQWLGSKFMSTAFPLRIVIDSGNGTGGVIAPAVFKALGCHTVELFSDPDGDFPNHHPDPCRHQNLRDLQAAVQEHQADFGIAFDGDSDRLGVVDDQGAIIPGDLLLLLFALAILEKPHEKPVKVVSEVKCTQVLFDRIKAAGGHAVMAPTGHAFIKQVMLEQNAMLGGELSGHFFFKDDHPGFDDAFYAALRFLDIVRQHKERNADFKVSTLLGGLPDTFLSEERRDYFEPAVIPDVMSTVADRLPVEMEKLGLPAHDTVTIDGIRLNLETGFILVRPSNTEPCVTIRYEVPNSSWGGKVDSMLDRLFEEFRIASAKV